MGTNKKETSEGMSEQSGEGVDWEVAKKMLSGLSGRPPEDIKAVVVVYKDGYGLGGTINSEAISKLMGMILIRQARVEAAKVMGTNYDGYMKLLAKEVIEHMEAESAEKKEG